MNDLYIALDEKQYRYLQQQARNQGTTVEGIVADLIDADIAWQQALADDPVAALFGEISDTLNSDEIDAVRRSSFVINQTTPSALPPPPSPARPS